MYLRGLISTLLLCLICSLGQAQVAVTRGKNLHVDAASDGRLVIDLLGDIWVVPGRGGDALPITDNLRSARRPRWSPDAQDIVFEATVDGRQGLWLYRLSSTTSQLISERPGPDRFPAWHPSGERITYAADRDGRGYDLWETDLATGLHWRLTARDGDETEPAWSSNGRDLVYVLRENGQWSLVMRRFGRRDEVLFRSSQRLAAPSWRPDGSLVTFYQFDAGRAVLRMVVLARPRLVRTLADDESFDATPVSWLDRLTFVYAAGGQLRRRNFDAWSSRPLRFRAVTKPVQSVMPDRDRPTIAWLNEPDTELVIHATRLFDGLNAGYQYNRDIVLSGGRIAAVEAHRSRSGAIVIDLGDVVVLPGYIDAAAELPADLRVSHGPDLLTMGVTTVVAPRADVAVLNERWSGKEVPGPRIVGGPGWQIGPQPPVEIDVTAAVSTSRGSGQPVGTALGAQFRSLQFAGLTPEQALRAVGVNAAAAMLADPYLGRVARGAAADLVFVDGDPLNDISDALNVIAVVRNGRFFSVSGLIDRAKAADGVE